MSRERMVGIAVAFIVVVFLLFVSLRWFEHAVTFHPVRYDGGVAWNVPARAQDVWLTTADGIRLHGWFFQTEKTPARATVIYFHGNGGNLSNVGWVGKRLADRGLDVLLLDYRGYGRSEGQIDGELGLYTDGDAAYDFVTQTRGVNASKIIFYGQSLGTAVAADLASRRQCGAVIIESGFSSASEMASNVFPWLPSRLHVLAKNRFESARKLSQAGCPLLITHGDPDEVIPTDQSRLLFAAAKEPKKLLLYPGAGHNVFGSLGDQYLDVVVEFITVAVGSHRSES